MDRLASINDYLQERLAAKDLPTISAVDAAALLDEAGLLRDSPTRPGKPLRDLLRGKLIVGQRQDISGRWFIDRVSIGLLSDDADLELAVTPLPEGAGAQDATAVDAAIRTLVEPTRRISAKVWPTEASGVEDAGLYAWWVDEPGAAALTDGLNIRVASGLIYAGQTGATSPSGVARVATLRSRIGRNHLRGGIRGSTFRWTLGAILAHPLRLIDTEHSEFTQTAERTLSAWMSEHLAVSVFPYPDRSSLRLLERQVLQRLDPPLNLDGMRLTPIRSTLRMLRSNLRR